MISQFIKITLKLTTQNWFYTQLSIVITQYRHARKMIGINRKNKYAHNLN